MAQRATPKPGKARRKGRFTSDYDNRGLYAAVAKVLKASGVSDDTYVSTRAFDDLAATTDGMENLPPARQIASRLKRSWPDVVDIAREKTGKPSHANAVKATTREVEDNSRDERHIVFALRAAARNLGLDAGTDTLTIPEYERARETLLVQARANGTLAFWISALPSSAQIETLADGSWDVALAIAELPMRDGVQLTKAGQAKVTALTKARSSSTVVPTGEARTAAVTTRGIVGGRPGRRNEPAPAPLVSGKPTAYTGRVVKPMSLERAVAEFVISQGAWPSSKGAVQAWAAHHRLSLPRLHGIDFQQCKAAATEMLTAHGRDVPASDNALSPGKVNYEAPISDGLPKRANKTYTRAQCQQAIRDCMEETGVYRDLTTRLYRDWATGIAGRPSQGAFDPHGGWETVKNEALEKLGK